MAKTREQKTAQVETLSQELRDAKMTVLVSYKGMTVKQAQELRTETKNNNGNFRVVKNAMLKLAASDAFKELDISDIDGPVAMVVSYDDQVMPAKTAMEYAKQYEILEPIGAINDYGQRLSAAEVTRLATLPSREELTGQLVGTIAAPLSSFVNVLGGNLRGLVTVLDGAANKHQ